MTACWRPCRVIGLLTCLLVPVLAFGQETSHADEPPGGRKGGTYLKLGLAHWQGDIFSEGSLTQWNVDLFGAKYNLTSLNAEIETYFGAALPISGFSVAYRKDTLQHADSGHMVSGMLFHDVDLKVFALKAGGGAEWGVPSLNFDQTVFDFADDGTVRYRHTYPERNAHVPFTGTRTGGALYPFAELSAVQRPGGLLLEAGIRLNMIRFHFDDYEVDPADRVQHAFTQRRVLVPYLFVKLGTRLF